MKQAKTWGSGLLFFLVMTVITGVIYTAVCTGIAQLVFPYQANGSIIEVDGVKYGSEKKHRVLQSHLLSGIVTPLRLVHSGILTYFCLLYTSRCV